MLMRLRMMTRAKKTNLRLMCLFVLLMITGCAKNDGTLKDLQALDRNVRNPSSVDELQDAIAKFDKAAQAVVKAQGRVGNWYKLLGSRYADKKMYGEALKSYQTAAEYFPANQNLHYWIGICAGTMAASSYDAKRDEYLDMAEKAYLRAISLEDRYVSALYALGVLYVFSLGRNEDAIPHLEKLLSIDKKNNDARFVLARAYYATEQNDRAIELYDLIIRDTGNAQMRAEAEANKQTVLQGSNGR
jgi:tetratricopeptide (TPR) repeat protein